MESKKYDGPEKRKNLRVIYNPEERPTLKVGENEFKVAGFSEVGIRFFHRKIEIGHSVRGTLILLCGESIDIEGMVVRKNKKTYILVSTLVFKRKF
jgi:hypothetical protein